MTLILSCKTEDVPPKFPSKVKKKRCGIGGIALLGFLILQGLVIAIVQLLKFHDNSPATTSVLLSQSLTDFIIPRQHERETGRTDEADVRVEKRIGDEFNPYGSINEQEVPSDDFNVWDESSVIPEWMKEYFAWHRQQRKEMTPENWTTKKYLVMQCLATDSRCGGTSDRLRPIPTLLMLAHQYKRILLIRWERPAKLEEFLLPPEGGLDWRVPDWMVQHIGQKPYASSLERLHRFLNADSMLVRSRYQSYNAGMEHYNQVKAPDEPSFAEVYHDLWRIVFTPSPPLATIIQDTLENLGLQPGGYAAAHLRAVYERTDRSERETRSWAINAVNCASELRPGGPIYFASDSKFAVESVKEYATRNNRKIVSLIHDKEPLHLEKSENWTSRHPSEYYDTFVDLYILGMSRCLAYNIGGFGRWGLVLGYNATCGKAHATKEAIIKCNWTDASDVSDEQDRLFIPKGTWLRKPMGSSL